MARITFEDKIALEEQGSIAEVNKITAGNMNEIKAAINNLENDFLPLTGGTLSGNLNFSHTSNATNGYITWNGGTYQQRLQIIDSSSDTAQTFSFQKSTDSGSTWSNLLSITNSGIVTATKFAGTLEGNASTATKATQDGRGNNIESTYLKLSGGTITGSLEINGTISAGYSTQSTFPTGKIKIHDLRSITVTPSMTYKGANFYFSSEGSPTGGWYSVLHVTGWSEDYNSWQLMGPSNNTDQRSAALYTRAGNSSTGWGNWRKIYDSGNTGDMQCGGSVYANGGYLFSTCNGCQVHIGSQNGGWCHYDTTAPAHWFNTQVSIRGPLYKGSDYNLNVPAVFIQSSTPTACQTGDIWFS